MTLRKIILATSFVALSALSLSAETLPASDNRFLTEADLVGMNASTLRIARNEIFARHGYAFNSSELSRHFSQYGWYNPYTKNVSLSRVEQQNVSFIKTYETSPQLLSRLQMQPVQQQPQVTTNTVVVVTNENSEELAELEKRFDALSKQVTALEELAELQRRLASEKENPTNVHAVAASEIEGRLKSTSTELNKISEQAKASYQTPIRPKQGQRQLSPRELSLSFPKVPWYEVDNIEFFGEFWLEPIVLDTGELSFALRFVDPNAKNERVTSEFSLTSEEAKVIRDALEQTFEWSDTAKEKGVRDRFQKEAGCTPKSMCDAKVSGNTSTQVDFMVFEGGATGARVIRNKGAYAEAYGMSIESAALLSSYFDYMIMAGEKDFQAGSRTAEDLDALFD